eukprot:6870128-Alexandrium_andersonii.AAC.1
MRRSSCLGLCLVRARYFATGRDRNPPMAGALIPALAAQSKPAARWGSSPAGASPKLEPTLQAALTPERLNCGRSSARNPGVREVLGLARAS